MLCAGRALRYKFEPSGSNSLRNTGGDVRVWCLNHGWHEGKTKDTKKKKKAPRLGSTKEPKTGGA